MNEEWGALTDVQQDNLLHLVMILIGNLIPRPYPGYKIYYGWA